MNNNRNSNSNRRRGRNPNRPQGGGSGGGNQLNRIDSRARGNAPQLLDKYKKLAQDAQHNGDRVQAEYFLQFADHYFRVINDNKLRQDEARAKGDNQGDGRSGDSQSQRGDDDNRRPRRQRSRDDDHDMRDDESGDDRGDDQGNDDDASNDRGQDRGSRDRPVKARTRSNEGRGRSNGSGRGRDDDGAGNDVSGEDQDVRAKAPRPARKPRAAKPAGDGHGEIDIAVLPPAIGRSADEAPAKKPALRPRRKRADDSETLV